MEITQATGNTQPILDVGITEAGQSHNEGTPSQNEVGDSQGIMHGDSYMGNMFEITEATGNTQPILDIGITEAAANAHTMRKNAERESNTTSANNITCDNNPGSMGQGNIPEYKSEICVENKGSSPGSPSVSYGDIERLVPESRTVSYGDIQGMNLGSPTQSFGDIERMRTCSPTQSYGDIERIFPDDATQSYGDIEGMNPGSPTLSYGDIERVHTCSPTLSYGDIQGMSPGTPTVSYRDIRGMSFNHLSTSQIVTNSTLL